MSRNRIIAVGLILLVVVAMFGIATVRGRKKVVRTTEQIQAEVGTPVQTAPVEVGSINDIVPVTGNIKALDSATVTSKIGGKVSAVTVREGDSVRRGQVLVQLDPGDSQENLRQAQAGLQTALARLSQARTTVSVTDIQSRAAISQAQAGYDSAQANLAKLRGGARTQERLIAENQVATAKANLDNARANLNRYKKLYAQGAVAEAQLEVYQTQFDVAQASYNTAKQNLSLVVEGARSEDIRQAQEAVIQARSGLISAKANASQNALRREDVRQAQAGVAQARAQVALAQDQLANTAIRSSVDGVVSQRMVDPGQSVAPTSPLMNVVSLRTVFFEADVSETVLAKVKPGQTVDVKVDAYPDSTFVGKVKSLNPAAQSGTRNFRVRVHIPNPGNALRPGMFSRGAIVTGGTQGAILIPQDAVEERNGQNIVFTVAKDTKGVTRAKLNAINRGLSNSQFVEVNPPTDVRAGDTIVTSGHEALQDNDKVLVGG